MTKRTPKKQAPQAIRVDLRDNYAIRFVRKMGGGGDYSVELYDATHGGIAADFPPESMVELIRKLQELRGA